MSIGRANARPLRLGSERARRRRAAGARGQLKTNFCSARVESRAARTLHRPPTALAGDWPCRARLTAGMRVVSMSTKPLGHLEALDERQRAQLEDCIEAFEQAWKKGEKPPIRDHLPSDAEIRPAALVELVCIDLEFRYKAGESPSYEDYRREYPELALDSGEAARLIHSEIAGKKASGRVIESLAAAVDSTNPTSDSTRSQKRHTLAPDPARSRSPERAPELSGVFGRYRVIKALGRGAMGTVYLAEDTQLGRLVALKTPNVSDDDSGELLQRFEREARAAAALRHPNICPVHDIGAIMDRHFISMAFIEGRPLADYAKKGRLQPESWIIGVIGKLALALQAAHDHGIIHRDLKPTNVMVDNHDEPIIMDFGLARLMFRREDDIRLTRDGDLLGSPAYMSPEQVEGDQSQIDARTDQYSIGVILYELLTGTLPFQGTVSSVIAQVVSKPPEPPRRWRPDLDPRIEAVCLRMMAKQPDKRFPSLKVVAAELEAIANGSARLPRERASWPRRAAAGVGLALLLLAAVLWWRQNGLRTDKGATTSAEAPPTGGVTSTTLSASADTSPLSGKVDIRIWDPKDAERRGLSLSDPQALPLHSGDEIRVEATLNRPAYLYLVWIAPDGAATPVYPWKNGKWESKPVPEPRVAQVSLPDPIDEGWPIAGGPGMETLVMLARDQPLNPGVPMKDFFAALGAQPIQNARSLVWLDEGEVPREKTRAPQFFEPKKLDDPLLRSQRVLSDRLKPLFPLIRAVSFANKGL